MRSLATLPVAAAAALSVACSSQQQTAIAPLSPKWRVPPRIHVTLEEAMQRSELPVLWVFSRSEWDSHPWLWIGEFDADGESIRVTEWRVWGDNRGRSVLGERSYTCGPACRALLVRHFEAHIDALRVASDGGPPPGEYGGSTNLSVCGVDLRSAGLTVAPQQFEVREIGARLMREPRSGSREYDAEYPVPIEVDIPWLIAHMYPASDTVVP